MRVVHVSVEYWPQVESREVFVTVWVSLVILGNKWFIRKVNIRFTKKIGYQYAQLFCLCWKYFKCILYSVCLDKLLSIQVCFSVSEQTERSQIAHYCWHMLQVSVGYTEQLVRDTLHLNLLPRGVDSGHLQVITHWRNEGNIFSHQGACRISVKWTSFVAILVHARTVLGKYCDQKRWQSCAIFPSGSSN